MLTIHQQFVKLNTEKKIIEFSNVVSHYSSWFNFQLKESIKIGHSVSFHFISFSNTLKPSREIRLCALFCGIR